MKGIRRAGREVEGRGGFGREEGASGGDLGKEEGPVWGVFSLRRGVDPSRYFHLRSPWGRATASPMGGRDREGGGELGIGVGWSG
jgi:hypothetical protein